MSDFLYNKLNTDNSSNYLSIKNFFIRWFFAYQPAYISKFSLNYIVYFILGTRLFYPINY